MDIFYVNGAITVPGKEWALSQNSTDPPVHHQTMASADQGPCVDWTVQGQLSPGEAEPLPPLQVCPKYHRGFGL